MEESTEEIQKRLPETTLLYIHRVNKSDSVVIYESTKENNVSASWFSISKSKRSPLGPSQRVSAYGVNLIDSTTFTIPLLPDHKFKLSSDRKKLFVSISNVECEALYVRLVFRPPELRPAYVEVTGRDLSDTSKILKDRYDGIENLSSNNSSSNSGKAIQTTLVHDLVVIRRSFPSISSSSSTTLYTTVFFVLSWITPAFGFICIGLGIMYALARRHALTSLRGTKVNSNNRSSTAVKLSSYPAEEKIVTSWLHEVPSEVRRGMEFVSPFIRVLSLCCEYVERLTTGDDTKHLYRVLYLLGSGVSVLTLYEITLFIRGWFV